MAGDHPGKLEIVLDVSHNLFGYQGAMLGISFHDIFVDIGSYFSNNIQQVVLGYVVPVARNSP